jgi:hypothetical protein
LQKRSQKTFRHLLQTSIVVAPQPLGPRQVVFEFSALDWTMISFADINHSNPRALAPIISLGGSYDGETHGIPRSILWRPGTTAGIA